MFKTTTRVNDKVQVCLGGSRIELVDSAKFLGVYIDSSLNWKTELSAVTSSVSSACYALRCLRDELQLKQLKMVYYALVESKLRYSILCWGNSYRYNVNAAFIAQKRAIRIIARVPQQTSCRPYFAEFGILTVPSLYILVVLTYLIKHIDDIETAEQRNRRLATRRMDLPHPECTRLNIAKHSAGYQNIVLFNKLPLELKLITNSIIFKNKLKSFLLRKCYYSIEEFCNQGRD